MQEATPDPYTQKAHTLNTDKTEKYPFVSFGSTHTLNHCFNWIKVL